MAGVYIHIPFCSSKCFYCDFFSRKLNDISVKEKYIEALTKEILLQKNYLNTNKIDTIYFGGGTPSVLNFDNLNKIFSALSDNFDLSETKEITFEANPEHLTKKYLSDLKNYTPVNRLSIGVQSFFDDDLKFMNRQHNAKQAINVIDNARIAGFNNLTIDLIYGLPEMSLKRWSDNLRILFLFDLPHFSAYHLTIEEQTVFGVWKKKGKLKEIDENTSWRMFEILVNETEKKGYEHYEISNFAKPGHYAVHNSSYWLGEKYLGIGSAAHSYDGNSRQWNVANITKYIEQISNNIIPAQKEVLTVKDKFNEYILSGLRTKWGINKIFMLENYPDFFLQIKNPIKDFIEKNFMIEQDDTYILTLKGLFVSDSIMAELIIV